MRCGPLANALISSADASGAPLPALGILATVKCDHQNVIALLSELDSIRKSLQHEPAELPVNQGKGSRIAADALHSSSESISKVKRQRRITLAVPTLALQKILHRLWQEAN
jgi:hypothetical protein